MKYRFLYLTLLFLFMGCAQLPESNPPIIDSWDTQQEKLEALVNWSFSGKLAIITPDERNSLNIHWQQSNQDFHISLTTFLGLTVLSIQKIGVKTTIIDAEGEQYSSEDTEQLITELSGMVLPINYLQEWVKGNPKEANYRLNERKLVSNLAGNDQHNGLWSINYNDYRNINSVNLPHKLQLKHENLRLKFSISTWEIPQS